ncbi:MAG: hypothetical protein AAGF11_07030 [Myxococcota bacterium]
MRHGLPRLRPHLGLMVALATPLACSNAETPESPKTEPKSAEAPAESEAEAEAKTSTTAKPKADETDNGLTKTIAAGISAASSDNRLERGDALGHIVLPSPTTLLNEVRTQAAPAKAAGFLDEGALRGLAGMTLGTRSGLAQHLSLKDPIGCVFIDDTATEVPVACSVGYEGGVEAAVADLGEENKQPEAEGHRAHYRVEGQDLYLDELDGHVVVTNHPALFAKAKDYLGRNVIGRASSITDDIEIVVYPKAAMARYSTQVEALTSTMRSLPMPTSGNPLVKAWTDYSRASMDRGLDYYRELDQIDFGMGLEKVGFVLRYALYPTPGSSTQSDSQAITSGPVDVSLVRQLPAESWLISGSTVDWKAAWGLESAAVMRDALLEGYATAVGHPSAEIRTAVEAFLDENASLYDDDMALAVAYLTGTQGGLIVSRKLAAPARDRWKPWTKSFTPKHVLGPEASKFVTWSFQADALEVDGVAVDRWMIEPGPETMAEIAKKKDPTLAEITRRFGGLKLMIDRVELPGRVLFVIAPGSQEAYIRAAIEATKSGGAGSDAGLTALLARNPDTSAVMAVNVAGALWWAREVLPAEATREIPAMLGRDLGDFYFSATYGRAGEQRGEMVLGQSMIDGIRKLAK